MSFKDDNLRFVLLKAVADAIADELSQMRSEHLGPLLDRYDEDGTKSFSVRLPGNGALIAALTLPESKDKYDVVDEAAFTAWFAENHPDAVEVETIPGEPERTVVVPATPDQTVTTINPKHRTAIMKGLDQTDDGQIVDPVTGSFVQGVAFTPGKRPDRFSVTYEPTGRDHLARAYRAGELDDLVTGTALPAAGDRVIVERRLEPAPPVVTVVPDQEGSDDYPEDLGPSPLPGERDPWTDVPVIGEQAADFDPGSWGAPATQTGTGW